MASVGDRLNDPEYRNWVRATLCILYTRDGLVTYAEQKSQELHKNVTQQFSLHGIPTANNPCGSFSFDKRKKTPCCNSCSVFRAEVEKYKYGISKFNVENSDRSCLLQQHWQIAKIFMNPGQNKTNSDPNKTDISGLINFLDHCLIPRQAMTFPFNIQKVRDTRNRVLHSADQKISDDDFQNNITPALVRLLEDPTALKNNPEAQLAVKKINEIKRDDFVITKESEKKALEELVNEIRQMMNRAKLIEESNQSTREEVNTAYEEIKKFQIVLEKLKNYEDEKELLRSDMQNLETSVETLRGKLSTKVKEISGKLETQTKQISDIQNQGNEDRERIKNLETNQLKTDAKIDTLKPVDQKPSEPSEADLGKLVQYLKDGYEKEKLQVLLPGFFKIPVCKIFSPVILIKKGLSDKGSSERLSSDKESSERLSSDQESSERLSSYKDMFYRGEAQNKQLFLVGEAGAGKSTYSKHLVDVWRNKSETPQFEDPEFVRQFQFVFHVSFRFAKPTDSIHDMICDQLFDDENMKSIAIKVLRHCPEKCFIITDGLDEWQCPPGKSTGRRGDIPGLPSRKGVEGCLTLITSRPWRLHALTTELERKYIFQLDGLLTPEKLIKNMLKEMGDSDPEKSCYKFLDQVESCDMDKMLKTPLILITVLSIWDKDQSLSPSVCQNYIRIIESIILRADDEEHWSGDETRLRKPLVHNLDTLKKQWEEKSGTLPSCCQKLKSFRTFAGLIISLSHLAFDLLFSESTSAEQKLVFAKQDCEGYLCEEEINVCLGIGILSQSQTSRARRKIESYSFIHKSFQEFLAALWLAGPGSADSVGRINERIREQGELGDLELLIKFLCGLVPEVGADILIYSYKHCDIYKFRDFVLACSVESQHCNNTTHVYPTLPGIIVVSRSISMDKFRMLTDILKSPSSGLRCLDIDHLSLDHSSIDLLYQSLSCCGNLEFLRLWRISCSDDRRCVSSVLDLQNLHKLEKLILWSLSVRTVLLPQVTNSCLRELDISYCNNISPVLDLQNLHKLEKLTLSALSVRTVLWPQVTNSCLRELDIRYCKNISPVLDLQNLHTLEKLTLGYLSVPTVLWPQVTNSCLRELHIRYCNNISPALDLRNLHKLEKLTLVELSVRTVLWPQVTNSCLRELDIVACNNISRVLDLQKLHKLEKLTLRLLSVPTVLWPQVTNSCLRDLYIERLNLTHGGVEELCRTYEQYRQLEMEHCEVRYISCVDHKTRCNSFEDLQKHILLANLLYFDDSDNNGDVDTDNYDSSDSDSDFYYDSSDNGGDDNDNNDPNKAEDDHQNQDNEESCCNTLYTRL